jgi:hypothetical protein
MVQRRDERRGEGRGQDEGKDGELLHRESVRDFRLEYLDHFHVRKRV